MGMKNIIAGFVSITMFLFVDYIANIALKNCVDKVFVFCGIQIATIFIILVIKSIVDNDLHTNA